VTTIGIIASRLAGRAATLTLAAVLVAGAPGTTEAAPAEITLPGDRAFPENLTSIQDGTLFVGSMAEGGIMRAAPGAAAAEPWIAPGADGTRSIFGLLADESTGTLWACSNDVSDWGIPGPGDAKGSWLKAFDLTTGRLKGSAALPGEGTVCNDIAIGPDGGVYVTDVVGSRVLKLRPGGGSFDVWAADEHFTPPPDGGGLDGIAFGSDGALYVNTFTKGGLFRVTVQDGAAGVVTALKPSRPLTLPDGLRPYDDRRFLMAEDQRFLMAEGGGTLDLVTVEGDAARIETLKDGLAGPVAVTQVGSTAWVAEGQLAYLFEPALKGKKPNLPFRIVAVPLPVR
jgi:sugar lactone lactonase YvrE